MKYCFLIIFIFFGELLFGQYDSVYKVDENIKLSLPSDFEVMDTLGMRIVFSISDTGSVSVIIVKNEEQSRYEVNSKEALKEYYSDFLIGFIKEAKAKLISQKECMLDSMLAMKFNYQLSSSNGKILANGLVLFYKDKTYCFEYKRNEPVGEKFEEESDNYFSFIKVKSGLESKQQFLSVRRSNNLGYKIGYMIGKYVLPAIIIISVILVVIVIVVKRRK